MENQNVMNQVSKVQEIVIIGAEGKIDYTKQFPKSFGNFQEVNKFFVDNEHYHTERGYDKHDICVTWVNGNTFRFRNDIACRTGNCYNSMAYCIEELLKHYMLYDCDAFERGETWAITNETYKSFQKNLVSLELSTKSKEELYKQAKADIDLADLNGKRLVKQDQLERFKKYKKEVNQSIDFERSKKEKMIEPRKGLKVFFTTGENAYMIVETEWSDKNPVTEEYEDYPVRKVFKTGDELIGRYKYYKLHGTLDKISSKTVQIGLADEYKPFVRNNILDFIDSNLEDNCHSRVY